MFAPLITSLLLYAAAGNRESPLPPTIARFETSDGVRIEGDYVPPPVAGRKGPVAILIHMYPADRKSWEPIRADLLRAGFGVLAYDIRGRGGSTEPAEKNLRRKYEAREEAHFREAWRDVEAAKKWLGTQPTADTARIVLVGASIGCSIALDYGGRDESVKGIVCLSPGTNYFGVDSVAHIRACGKRPILLMAPEAEYEAVEALIKASGGSAKGEKQPGGREYHGTNMFRAAYGARVKASIVAFLKKAAGQ
jgi:pimeloyl-ACP methyl ester carboxylesterase